MTQCRYIGYIEKVYGHKSRNIFNTTGTTTLAPLSANLFSTANGYVQRGTLTLVGGVALWRNLGTIIGLFKTDGFTADSARDALRAAFDSLKFASGYVQGAGAGAEDAFTIAGGLGLPTRCLANPVLGDCPAVIRDVFARDKFGSVAGAEAYYRGHSLVGHVANMYYNGLGGGRPAPARRSRPQASKARGPRGSTGPGALG
jgi:hypothetical protein